MSKVTIEIDEEKLKKIKWFLNSGQCPEFCVHTPEEIINQLVEMKITDMKLDPLGQKVLYG